MGSVNGKVFSVMGPNNYQINSLGIFSGNDPVKNLDGQNRQSPIAIDFGSRTQIAALFAVLPYRSV